VKLFVIGVIDIVMWNVVEKVVYFLFGYRFVVLC